MKYKDQDGNAWEDAGSGQVQQPLVCRPRPREEVERLYGPLVPIPEDSRNIQFHDWYEPGASLKRCSACGALVTGNDRVLHRAWHDMIARVPVLQIPDTKDSGFPDEGWRNPGQIMRRD